MCVRVCTIQVLSLQLLYMISVALSTVITVYAFCSCTTLCEDSYHLFKFFHVYILAEQKYRIAGNFDGYRLFKYLTEDIGW